MGRRAAAWLVDGVLGLLLAAAFVDLAGGAGDLSVLWHALAFKSVSGPAGREVGAALHPASPTGLSALGPALRLLALLAVVAAAGVAYRVVTVALWGAGLGKHVLGLRVVVACGDPERAPGWACAWKRWAVPQVPGLIPLPATGLLAYLPAFRDPARRGLHDRAAGTVVVSVGATAYEASAAAPSAPLASATRAAATSRSLR